MARLSKEELAKRYATNNPAADKANAGIPPRAESTENLDQAIEESAAKIASQGGIAVQIPADDAQGAPREPSEEDLDAVAAEQDAVEATAQPMSAFNPEIHAVHADTGMPKTDARGQFIQKQHDYVQPQATETAEIKAEPALKAAKHRRVPWAESHPYADHAIHEEGHAPTYHKPTEGSKV